MANQNKKFIKELGREKITDVKNSDAMTNVSKHLDTHQSHIGDTDSFDEEEVTKAGEDVKDIIKKYVELEIDIKKKNADMKEYVKNATVDKKAEIQKLVDEKNTYNDVVKLFFKKNELAVVDVGKYGKLVLKQSTRKGAIKEQIVHDVLKELLLPVFNNDKKKSDKAIGEIMAELEKRRNITVTDNISLTRPREKTGKKKPGKKPDKKPDNKPAKDVNN